jgi:hypothetical protein
MRKTNRSALWALGLAGAAYLWRNRSKLQQRANDWQSNRGTPQLPDFGSGAQQDRTNRTEGWGEPSRGRFSGTEV